MAAASEAIGGAAPQTMLTGGIRQAYANGVAKLKKLAQSVASGPAGDGKTCEGANLFAVSGSEVVDRPELLEEVFGASSLLVRCKDVAELAQVLESLEGQLTATLHMDEADHAEAAKLVPILEKKVGRILANGWPTGVEVAHAMVHGGPYPATTDGRSTSVGTLAIERFLRPVSYQAMPAALLPPELRDGADVPRLFDGKSEG